MRRHRGDESAADEQVGDDDPDRTHGVVGTTTSDPSDTPGLDGRVAIVTGATSGIGAVTAAMLAAAGVRVVVAGRRADRGNEVVDRIRAAGGEARFAPVDVSSTAAVDAMVAETIDTWGALDIAVNNAGVYDRAHDFADYSDEAWDEVIAVDLTGVFRCMRAEIAAMAPTARGRGGAAIVNVASIMGHRGSSRASPAYVAAKHGVLGLTRQAAVTSVHLGIRVNAVSPGPTRSEVTDALVALGPEAVRKSIAPLNPRAELIAAEDVAAAILYLCGPAAGMINGQDIVIDGGQTAQL